MALKMLLQAGNGSLHPFACFGCHRCLWTSASRDECGVGRQGEQWVPSMIQCLMQGVPEAPGSLGLMRRLDIHKSHPIPVPRCFRREQSFLFLLYSRRAMHRMHLQESHSLNLHRSYFSFLPLHPLPLFANRSPCST